MLLGSHVSMSGKKMLLGTAEEVVSYGSSTFMIYTGAPQNTRGKVIEGMNIDAGEAFTAENGLTNIVVHVPCIINLGSAIKPEMFPFAVQFLREEIVRAEVLGVTQITLHPGAHVGVGAEAGIARITEELNEALTKEQTTQIALETMARKGMKIGRTFEELAQIIDGVKLNGKLSVALDTCHTNDTGYNIKEDLSGVMEEFDKVIRLDRFKVLHINDFKNPQGSHKDRHANIGLGTIGFDTLNKIIHDLMSDNISRISETPYIGKDKKKAYAPYGKEISMFKAQAFDLEVFPESLAEEVAL